MYKMHVCFDSKLAVCAFTGFAAKGWHKQLRLQAHPKTQWEISEAEHHLPVRQVDVCFLILSPARPATSFVWMYGADSSLKLEEECPIIIIRTLCSVSHQPQRIGTRILEL
jgi:hypothetical protein